jgi:hypothetical protein
MERGLAFCIRGSNVGAGSNQQVEHAAVAPLDSILQWCAPAEAFEVRIGTGFDEQGDGFGVLGVRRAGEGAFVEAANTLYVGSAADKKFDYARIVRPCGSDKDWSQSDFGLRVNAHSSIQEEARGLEMISRPM